MEGKEGAPGVLTINEIFFSVQGESSHAGRPCVFVRLTGCDLRCVWCDTPYAFDEGQRRTIDEVVAVVEAFDCTLVEVTGGEPLLQHDVYPLMDRLVALGKTVLLETGGHLDLSSVPSAVRKIVDVKCPGSGEAHRADLANLDRLHPHDEVKFVIADRPDYEYARAIVDRHTLVDRCRAVLFSPVHRGLEPRTLSEWILEDGLPVRLQLQLHKYIWSDDARGV